MDNLTEAVKQAHRNYEECAAVVDTARDAMRALVTDPQQRQAVDALVDAISQLYDANEHITVRELARHVPGFGLAIIGLYDHITNGGPVAGTCCEARP